MKTTAEILDSIRGNLDTRWREDKLVAGLMERDRELVALREDKARLDWMATRLGFTREQIDNVRRANP